MMHAVGGRRLLMKVFLVLLVVLSAVAVTVSVHESRRLIAQLQTEQRSSVRLQSVWSQLQLEQGTWGSYSKIEQLARAELHMHMPTAQEKVVVQP